MPFKNTLCFFSLSITSGGWVADQIRTKTWKKLFTISLASWRSTWFQKLLHGTLCIQKKNLRRRCQMIVRNFRDTRF
jgi:hypothetical protein